MTKTRFALQNLNPRVVSAEYAVRGDIAIRADQLVEKLKNKATLPFKNITSCNIGNPHQLGQKPITFFRQVAALVENPELLEYRDWLSQKYPLDAIQRAEQILNFCDGNIGAYSHSQGIPSIRKNVAKFISERDGYNADPNNIFLTAASQGVQQILQCLIQHDNVGIMIPIPQYPLYTATLSLNNGKPVPYFLDEKANWSLSIGELSRAVQEARKKQVDVRALCVINPGNPTGNVLSLSNMRDIVKFCRQENLVLLADEVYQTNVYFEKKPFHSFKKVISSMDQEMDRAVELFSFHSISKGMVGECGRRGGYFEAFNISKDVMEQVYKLASISLCPSVQGQIMVDLMTQPPKRGDESFELYNKEITQIYDSLKRRSRKLVEAFNKMEGVSCQEAEGAMYTFPAITLPPKAIAAAKKIGKQPDTLYCLEMLDATGVCTVPGSGFGQKEGTYHFRATFLPPEELFDDFIARLSKFHQEFMNKYR